jgi:hypothetical protein
VASFPTTVVEGMLFAWLESGPEAEQEAAAQQPYIMPEQVRKQLRGWQLSGLQPYSQQCCGQQPYSQQPCSSSHVCANYQRVDPL